MAISYITASTGSTDAGGAWSHTSAAPGAAGRILIVQVVQDGTSASNAVIDSVTNAENLAGTDNTLTSIGEFAINSSASQHLWIGRSLSTSAMVITGSNAGTDDLYIRVYEFSGVHTGTTLASVIENVTAGATTTSSGTSTTVADAGVTTLGTNRLALNFIGFNDDLTGFDGSFTSETGGNWATVASYGTSTGTDAALNLNTAAMAAAGTIDGGTMTITSMSWGVVGFALIPADDPTLSQTEAGFYEDGTEAGSSVIDSGADSITRDVSGGDSNLQLRVRLQETNASNGLSTDYYQLQYELNDSGTYYNVGSAAGSIVDSYSETNQNDNTTFNALGGANNNSVGQSFTGNGTTLGSVKWLLNKANSPTGTLTTHIYAHTGTFGVDGVPTGGALASSSTLDVSTLTTTYTLYEFTFTGANQITLSNGTNYVAVITITGGFQDGTNRPSVGADSSSPTHGGIQSRNTSGVWAVLAGRDSCFYVYDNGVSASAPIQSFASASLTDGNATTNRLGSGTGSFVAGEISEDGLVDNLQITASNYTELLYSLTIESTAVADNDTLDFRVLRNGATTGMTYTVTPRITIEKSAGGAAVKDMLGMGILPFAR